MITYDQKIFITQAIDSELPQRVNLDYEIAIGEDCSAGDARGGSGGWEYLAILEAD